MKKGLATLLFIIFALLFVSCDENVVKLYIWGSYMDEEVLAAFTEETGIQVKTILFDSNEIAITQIKSSSFDVCVPSDYAIEQLIEEDLLAEIDFERVMEEVDYEGEIGDFYIDAVYQIFDYFSKDAAKPIDIQKYAVPYFLGVVSLLYNTKTVDRSLLEELNWDALTLPEYKTSYYDSARDSFMVALKTLGYSANTEDPKELEKAFEYLMDAKNETTSYKVDQILDEMIGDPPVHDIAMVYSGDGIYLMTENESLDLYKPTTGTDVWMDAMVIPKNAKNEDGAYRLISWLSSYDAMMANTEYVGYTSPRRDVYEQIVSEDGSYYDYEEHYRIEFDENDESYRHLPVGKRIIDDYWNQIRAYEPYRDDMTILFYVFAGIGAASVGFYCFYRSQKKRKNRKNYLERKQPIS
jgi:spermidine/putrescine-binding protein